MITFYYRSFSYTTFKANANSFQNTTLGLWCSFRFFWNIENSKRMYFWLESSELESLQYNTCLAITGAIRGPSREKLYQELGFESVQQCRWCRKNQSRRYLFNIIPIRNPAYSTRNHVNIPLFKTNHNFFKNSFFPSTIIKWNNLDPNLKNADNYGTFKNTI